MMLSQPCARGHLYRVVEREAPNEDAEPPETCLLGSREQAVAPVHQGEQVPVPRVRSPRTGSQDGGGLVEAAVDFDRVKRSDSSRGQLDRQRQAVEAPADRGNRAAVESGR